MTMRTKEIMDYLQTERQKFKLIGKDASERLRKAPEGTVYINKRKNSFQFYLRTDPGKKNGVYLPGAEREKAFALIRKKYDQQIASAAEKQAAVLDRFIKNYDPECLKRIYESESDIRKEIIMPVELPDPDFEALWQSVQYERKPIGIEVPEHYSDKGERVRSKSEVMIADALAQAGIPYRYECPLLLGDITIHPDFTILRTADKSQIYWEHLGMMDDPEYVMKNLRRIRLYEQNELMPGINLILTMETSQQPINLTVIKQMIRTYCI